MSSEAENEQLKRLRVESERYAERMQEFGATSVRVFISTSINVEDSNEPVFFRLTYSKGSPSEIYGMVKGWVLMTEEDFKKDNPE